MSEEKKENSVNVTIFGKYKKYFFEKTGLISFLTLVIVLCLALAFFFPFTLILTVPFIVIPLFLGFIIINFYLPSNPGKPHFIFRGFIAYYSPPFFGIFRVILGLIKSIGIYLLSSTILILILFYTVGMKDPNFASIIDRIVQNQNNVDLLQLSRELQANSSFLLIENVSVMVSVGLAAYMFVHHILVNSFKVHFNFVEANIKPARAVNLIHKGAIGYFRKDFYRDYYFSIWYMILLFVGGYVGGVFLGYLVLHFDGMQSSIIGLFFAVILSIYFLPIIFDTFSIMFAVNIVYYYKSMLSFPNEVLDFYGIKMSLKEKTDLKMNVEAMEAMIKQFEEDEKAEKAKKKLEKKTKHSKKSDIKN